ncbi:hypothetical protein [Aquimarina brevivitae]|uniref:Uncharacterized protein n=1 Tax=Aquimarina brevivitae TaxID=323412 RepID=A0A4Q7PGZ7_9FLAO|nr:hypothetical protein [Aquimarina brevivitae]RZS99198.1 hypothetical protein EV197_0407 [Aquimarina brevivitae]
MQQLAYNIPGFKTIAWVSDAAENVWATRFVKVDNAIIDTTIRMITDSKCRSFILIVEGAMYFKILDRIKELPIDLEVVFLGKKTETGPVFYEIRLTHQLSVTSENSSCCIVATRRARQHSQKEQIWQAALTTHGIVQEEELIKLPETSDSSVFFQKLIVTVGPQHRCCLDCSNQRKQIDLLFENMESYGFVEELNWLQEIYSWPVEWSVMHGICELRTPVVKLAYDTDATPIAYTVQLDGSSYPIEGASGKRFPYRKKSFLRVSDSKSFKAGLQHGS